MGGKWHLKIFLLHLVHQAATKFTDQLPRHLHRCWYGIWKPKHWVRLDLEVMFHRSFLLFQSSLLLVRPHKDILHTLLLSLDWLPSMLDWPRDGSQFPHIIEYHDNQFQHLL